MNTIISRIYDAYRRHRKTMGITMIIVDLLLLFYYFSLFAGLLPHEEIWNKMYAAVNPFTTGAYILGAAILIQYIMYDNWIMKVLLSAFYGWVVLMSLVVTMGMTSAWELCIYIPHLVVIVFCGIVTYRKQKVRAGTSL